LVDSFSIATATTEELLLRTSCDPKDSQDSFRGSSDPLFLSKYLKKDD
jgi:hypothetical protein